VLNVQWKDFINPAKLVRTTWLNITYVVVDYVFFNTSNAAIHINAASGWVCAALLAYKLN
jgi:hypothetical protein